jgi:hypothetical protein
MDQKLWQIVVFAGIPRMGGWAWRNGCLLKIQRHITYNELFASQLTEANKKVIKQVLNAKEDLTFLHNLNLYVYTL